MSPSKVRTFLPVIVMVSLLLAAAWVLYRELHAIDYHDVHQALRELTLVHVGLALLFTGANFLVSSCYDILAFSHIGKPLQRVRIAATAALSYAVSNSVGFTLLSGTAVRHRFYSRWGVTTSDLSRIVVFNSTTYWLGLFALAGWSLTFHPGMFLQGGMANHTAVGLGILCCLIVVGYLALSVFRRAPMRVRGFTVRFPTLSTAGGQLLVSVVDWFLAATVLYVLLPDSGPSYGILLSAFLAAQLLGVLSHVPGGVGVFDSVMVVLLGPYLPIEQILAVLILYRFIYYIIPLVIALVALVGDELKNRQAQLSRFSHSVNHYSVHLAPKVLSLFTFIAGTVLLFSGATPAEHERLHWLASTLPTSLFETTHFLNSLIGVGLLILAQAVSRRIEVAYYLVMVGLAAGVATSLLKAADWEEALVLILLILAFIPARHFFDRKVALFETRFSPQWIAAIFVALCASIWLGMFAFSHVEYANDLWWQVGLNQDAPRFLRASLGAAVMLLAFSSWHLMRPLKKLIQLPNEAEISQTLAIINDQQETLPYLAWLKDKALLFNVARTGFIMYGVNGRTWVALGDPVGPEDVAPGLIREFIEQANDYGGMPIFYQVRPSTLHLYADLGMSFIKLGEEARVALPGFSLEGKANKNFRTLINKLERENVTFRIIPAEQVPTVMAQLQAISDEWLTTKSVSEKSFSLGCFDADYIARFPVAVLEQEGSIVAFANVWCGAGGEEVSVDLMRYSLAAPAGAMDSLFIHLMLWGRDNHYQWFNLGMSPLSGLEKGPTAPLWAKVAGFVYKHGETLYNFEGLRAYKSKFHPVWQARYLAYPGKLGLPVVMADIAALSAGGYSKIFR